MVAGYAVLAAWAEGFGALKHAGIESSGSFGVALIRFLRARGVEVTWPNRRHRRAQERRRSRGDGTCPARGAAFGGQARTQVAYQLRAARHRARKAQGKSCAVFPRSS
jgi:transposase